MLFDTVAIVGVGLIGGSVGLALKKRRLARCVVGIGRRVTSLRQARRMGAVDRCSSDLRRGVADAELTVFCTPVNLIPRQVRLAAAHCPPCAVLTDSGSTKAHIVSGLESGLPHGVIFVGSHPLAGSEKRGVGVARADLFQDRVCVVTPTPNTPVRAQARVEQLWKSLGSRVVTMSPEEHDLALAYTSHLPHLAAAALSIVLPEKYKDVVASGFRDTTRIAASDPTLWTAIFLDNAGPLLEALQHQEQILGLFREALKSHDAKAIRHLWKVSQTKRQRLNASLDGKAACP